MRLVTVGVGAARPSRYAPAGLLVTRRGVRVMVDGGPGAEPSGRLDAWLVTDERAELLQGSAGSPPTGACARTRAALIKASSGSAPTPWSTLDGARRRRLSTADSRRMPARQARRPDRRAL
jgi:hypothetical protein